METNTPSESFAERLRAIQAASSARWDAVLAEQAQREESWTGEEYVASMESKIGW